MMRYDDLYGCKCLTVEELARLVSRALNLEMEPHDSDSYGEYFRTPELSGEEISVQPNYVDYGEEEDELIEDEFPDYPVIVRVGATTRGEEIRLKLADAITALDFLRRDEW